MEGFKDKIFFSYSNNENNNLPNVINFGINLSSQINALEKVFNQKKIPFRSFEIYKRNEKTLGELFCFFML